jgi:hypothetical protein
MACDPTRSRGRQCKSFVGGNSEVWLYKYNGSDAWGTVTAGEVSSLSGSVTAAYKYVLDGDGNTFEEVTVGQRNEGSRITTQTLTFFLSGLSALDAAEFNLIAASYSQIVVKDRNGKYRAVAIDDGADFSITGTTGGAKLDASGYTVVATSTTTAEAPYLDSTAITALLAIEVAA